MENIQNDSTEIKEEISGEVYETAAGGKFDIYAEYVCVPCRQRIVCRYRGHGPVTCKYCGLKRAVFVKFIKQG